MQKYATLIGKGAYVNKLEIEDGVDAANQVFGGKYVAKRYSSVPDSLVSVSSGEIKSFYNAHKEMFKQSPSRMLSYVVFEVNATDDDMLNLEKEVRAVGEKFDAAEDVKLFVRQDRHGEIADRYVTAAQLGEQAEALVAGKMFGPELKNNVWTMARVVESRMAPDTLGLKMIVLPYTAEKLADSLKTVATSENFADLSRQYSANEELAAAGGEVGVYPFSAFNTVMAEALSDARKGDVVKVMSGDAIQLVNVYRADKPSKHYKVATVSYPVEASAATLRDVHNQASTFAVNAKGSAAAFNEAASKAAVTPRIATLNMVTARFAVWKVRVKWPAGLRRGQGRPVGDFQGRQGLCRGAAHGDRRRRVRFGEEGCPADSEPPAARQEIRLYREEPLRCVARRAPPRASAAR